MSFPVHYTTMYIVSVQNKQNIDTASHLKLNSDSMSSIVTEYPYRRTWIVTEYPYTWVHTDP